MMNDDDLIWDPEFLQTILNNPHSAWETIVEATKEKVGQEDAEKICTVLIRTTLDDFNWSPYLQ